MSVKCGTIEHLREVYSPKEWKAIEEHKYFLGMEMHFDPGFERAVESWERFHAYGWRARKMREDAEAQIQAIENYRLELCKSTGRNVPFNEAAREWIDRFGAEWRRQRELGAAADAGQSQ